ncbi:hypothetical protein DIZ66_04450, partial [Legionella pneumophila]
SLQFTLFNLISAILWIGSLLSLGYYLGSIPLIKENFSLVIYGVIAISILPPIIALISKKSTSSIKK